MCKVIKESLSRNQAVQNWLAQSGSASEDQLWKLQREKELYEEEHRIHKENAEKSRVYYKDAIKTCTAKWNKISEILHKLCPPPDELRELKVLQHCFYPRHQCWLPASQTDPFWGEIEQPGSTYYLQKASTDIFGIIDHRDKHGHVYLFDEHIGFKNTDHMVSLLTWYWDNVVATYPWVQQLMIFLDNATSTNKNRYLFGWATEMVSTGKLDFVRFSFLLAGHTKFSPDWLFLLALQILTTRPMYSQFKKCKHCLLPMPPHPLKMVPTYSHGYKPLEISTLTYLECTTFMISSL